MRLDKLRDVFSMLGARADGIRADSETLATFAADNRLRQNARSDGYIGVLPIIGSIVHRGNMFTEASGTASSDVIGKQFDALLANADVSHVVLEIDSPGGQAQGIQELAAKIAGARGQKPIIAHVNPEAASAAYWLATAADEIVSTPSGEVGSIGAYAYHLDYSAANEQLGVKPTFISYGEYKTEGNSDGPLSDDALAEIQARVDRVGKRFESDVAKYRGVPLAAVQSDWGRGRMIEAERAKKLGMIDRIGTLEETIGRIASGQKIKRRAAAERLRLEIL
jgi:signal peptide peptidase SppA